MDHIQPLLDYGHMHYGENKVQATAKWNELKKLQANIQLHMVGKLQSNKAKDAGKLFDYLSLNHQAADILSKYQSLLNKKLKYFIREYWKRNSKMGIRVNELDAFYNYCVDGVIKLVGLIVILL